MSEFKESLTSLGLSIPDAELPGLEAMMADLERAAAIVRKTERGYWEEPCHVLRLRPR